MSVTEVVCCIVRNQQGKVLAAQRAYGDSAGRWEFAGGKIETGESAEDACMREMDEELGIQVDKLEFYDEENVTVCDKPIRLLFYKCFCNDKIRRMKDHSQVLWLDAKELVQLDWLEGDLRVVGRLVSE